MELRKHLYRALAHVLHDRVATAINIGNGLGLLLLVAAGYAYRLDLAGWILGWLLISGLSNLLLAWNNERRQAAGRETTWNETVGRPVTVCTRFEARARGYGGTVQLGTERWRATSRVPLAPGQAARVTARHGLVLEVEPCDPLSQGPGPRPR